MNPTCFAQKAQIYRTFASLFERGRIQVSIAISSQVAEAMEIPRSKLFCDMERFSIGELTEGSVGEQLCLATILQASR